MANKKNANRIQDQGALSTGAWERSYEIRVKGHLDESWSDWLEGLEVTLLDNGEMILSGHIADQAALMGVLIKLHGLNLALLSVSDARQEKKIQETTKKENKNGKHNQVQS
jgi:hypothetical protein